jgi:hypothetical protein
MLVRLLIIAASALAGSLGTLFLRDKVAHLVSDDGEDPPPMPSPLAPPLALPSRRAARWGRRPAVVNLRGRPGVLAGPFFRPSA